MNWTLEEAPTGNTLRLVAGNAAQLALIPPPTVGVVHLVLGYGSVLPDLSIVETFPDLRTVTVETPGLSGLWGIEKRLQIETVFLLDGAGELDLAPLAELPALNHLWLHRLTPSQDRVVRGIQGLKHLALEQVESEEFLCPAGLSTFRLRNSKTRRLLLLDEAPDFLEVRRCFRLDDVAGLWLATRRLDLQIGRKSLETDLLETFPAISSLRVSRAALQGVMAGTSENRSLLSLDVGGTVSPEEVGVVVKRLPSLTSLAVRNWNATTTRVASKLYPAIEVTNGRSVFRDGQLLSK